jgi:putative YphP/YqiW family bacilliredoxin
MRYPEPFIAPMREELTRHGAVETRTPEEVDKLLSPDSGTVLMVINSVCGCAAGRARPGVVLSLQQPLVPDTVATVFAGGDVEAVSRVRERLAAYPPSSPSVALFRDGEPVFMLHRHEIEGREAPEIAGILSEAYQRHCQKQPT